MQEKPLVDQTLEKLSNLITAVSSGVSTKPLPLAEPMGFYEGDTLDTWMTRLTRYFDFDTARFIELIWTVRGREGLKTQTRSLQFPRNAPISRKDFTAELDGYFPISLKTENSFRAYISEADVRIKLLGEDPLEIPEYMYRLMGVYIMVGWDRDVPAMIVTGNPEWVNATCDAWLERYREPESAVVKTLDAFTDQGPIVREDVLVEGKTEIIGKDEFYPFLTVPTFEGPVPFTFQKFLEEFKASTEQLLFIYGVPGTGKTSFARRLMFGMDVETTLTASGKITAHPNFLPWLAAQGGDNFVVIEDAHDLVLKRELGNEQMSALLNFLDGIVSTGKKTLITSNVTSTSKIDPALLRPGRCFGVFKFTELFGDEINRARTSINRPEIDFKRFGVDPAKGMTLSEVLNYRPSNGGDPHNSRGVGFY